MSNYRRVKNKTNKNKNNIEKSNNKNKISKEEAKNSNMNISPEKDINADRINNNDDDGSFGKVIITDDIKGGKINVSENHDTKNELDSAITKTAEGLKAINVIKEEVCKLPLDPCEKEYIENCILPILAVAEGLARTSASLSGSVEVLSASQIKTRKRSKIKDTIDLIYDLNEQVEDVYDVVKKRIDKFVDCIK